MKRFYLFSDFGAHKVFFYCFSFGDMRHISTQTQKLSQCYLHYNGRQETISPLWVSSDDTNTSFNSNVHLILFINPHASLNNNVHRSITHTPAFAIMPTHYSNGYSPFFPIRPREFFKSALAIAAIVHHSSQDHTKRLPNTPATCNTAV